MKPSCLVWLQGPGALMLHVPSEAVGTQEQGPCSLRTVARQLRALLPTLGFFGLVSCGPGPRGPDAAAVWPTLQQSVSNRGALGIWTDCQCPGSCGHCEGKKKVYNVHLFFKVVLYLKAIKWDDRAS